MRAPENLALGATIDDDAVTYRVWAPQRRSVEVEFDDDARARLPLKRSEEGFFSGRCDRSRAGDLYRFRLDEAESHADPYSRFQPTGPHGPSMIVDPRTYEWRDQAWTGLDRSTQVIYEMHVGTFTEEGTYRAASEKLAPLRDLGITCIELMPVHEFVGRFGWGYDGVNWFAPFHQYGPPDALRATLIERTTWVSESFSTWFTIISVTRATSYLASRTAT